MKDDPFNPQRILTTSIATLHVEERGLIVIIFTKDAELDERCAIEILSAIHQLSEGNAHALLYDFNGNWIRLSNIAKKLASARNSTESKLNARAFLTSSLQHEMEAGHFIHYSKPVCETRIFKEKKEAIAWLRSHLPH
jgi:hypothetical protein